MKMHRSFRAALLSLMGAALLGLGAPGQQLARRAQPDPLQSLQPVAESQLLMRALAHPNFKALDRALTGKPEKAEAWSFARGQALLIAEAGNLLLLRPPRNDGKDVWTKRAVELRESATVLARRLADRDLDRSQTALLRVSNVCNRCHFNFKVPAKITPFLGERK